VTIALYVDEDSMRGSVVAGLRALGIDVLTTTEAGQTHASDEDQLRFATAEGRVIITFNRGDFARLHALWVATGRSHSGIIALTKQRTPIGVLVRKLSRVVEVQTPAQMTGVVLYLNDDPDQRLE
jgi:uncharacterized protein with PIN domain